MQLLFLGRLSDLVDDPGPVPDGIADTQALRDWLAMRFPDVGEPLVQIAVNRQLTRGAVRIANGDEIAFLPPMSGG